MKLRFGFGFNGGHLEAECDTFEEADSLLQYALKRGIVTVTVPTENGGKVEVDLTSNDKIIEEAKAAPPKVVRGYTKDEVMSGAVPPAPKETFAPADAAQAVKDYAAKNGVEAGRALLAKFGLKRTNEITADNAAAIIAATKE